MSYVNYFKLRNARGGAPIRKFRGAILENFTLAPPEKFSHNATVAYCCNFWTKKILNIQIFTFTPVKSKLIFVTPVGFSLVRLIPGQILKKYKPPRWVLKLHRGTETGVSNRQNLGEIWTLVQNLKNFSKSTLRSAKIDKKSTLSDTFFEI